MPSNDYLKSLSTRLASLFPEPDAVRKDLEGNIHALLRKNFDRLQVVTREDFDAQLAALRRAENTIAALEARIKILEQQCEPGTAFSASSASEASSGKKPDLSDQA